LYRGRREGRGVDDGRTPVNRSISILNLFLSNLAPPEVSRLNADAIVVCMYYVYVYAITHYTPTLSTVVRNSDSVDVYTVGRYIDRYLPQ